MGARSGPTVRIDRVALRFVYVDPVVGIRGDVDRLRTYSALNLDDAKTLYRNSTGYDYTGNDYNALLQALRLLGQRFVKGTK